jgi:hypothetical protein
MSDGCHDAEIMQKEMEEERKKYQIKRADEYLKNNLPKDYSEPSLEWCIISDLLIIIRNGGM